MLGSDVGSLLAAATAAGCAATTSCTASATASTASAPCRTGCAAATATAVGRGQRGLRAEDLLERLVGAHFVGIAAANAYCAYEVVIDDDGQAATDEVVAEALFSAEVEADETAIDVGKALRHSGGRGARVEGGAGLHQAGLGADGE